jgi:RND family efflux transporter MFP subunit
MLNRMTLLFYLLTAMGLFQGCGKIEPGNTAGDSGQAVRTAIAVAGSSSSRGYSEAVGTVKAETASTLSGKLLGAVRAVNVREGDHVARGQILIVIDDRQVSAQLQQAEAALEEAFKGETAAAAAMDAARAGAELAQSTYRRYQKLMEDNASSRQEFEEVEMRSLQAEAALKQAEAAHEAAKEGVKKAEATVSFAEVSKKDSEISAPFDGVITARMVDVGDLSAPGTPLLSIEKSGALEIEAIIPEDRIQMIAPMQDLDVVIPVLQNTSVKGTVKSIVTAADPRSRTFIVRIGVPEISGLHSGIFARIRVPSGPDRMIMVPSSAVVTQGQLTGLFIIDDDMIARFRIVRLGRRTGDSFEVISGIRDGARYVLFPPAGFKDGTRVEASS